MNMFCLYSMLLFIVGMAMHLDAKESREETNMTSAGYAPPHFKDTVKSSTLRRHLKAEVGDSEFKLHHTKKARGPGKRSLETGVETSVCTKVARTIGVEADSTTGIVDRDNLIRKIC